MTEHVGQGGKIARCLIAWETHLRICEDCRNDVVYGRAYNLRSFMKDTGVRAEYFDQLLEETEKILRRLAAERVAARLVDPKQSGSLDEAHWVRTGDVRPLR